MFSNIIKTYQKNVELQTHVSKYHLNINIYSKKKAQVLFSGSHPVAWPTADELPRCFVLPAWSQSLQLAAHDP